MPLLWYSDGLRNTKMVPFCVSLVCIARQQSELTGAVQCISQEMTSEKCLTNLIKPPICVGGWRGSGNEIFVLSFVAVFTAR